MRCFLVCATLFAFWGCICFGVDEDFEPPIFYNWHTSPSLPWILTTERAHSGQYSARSAYPYNTGYASDLWIEMRITRGQVSFWYYRTSYSTKLSFGYGYRSGSTTYTHWTYFYGEPGQWHYVTVSITNYIGYDGFYIWRAEEPGGVVYVDDVTFPTGSAPVGAADTHGVYDQRTGRFYLKNTLSGGVADITVRFGPVSPGNIFPLAGDWNADGRDTIGVYDARTGTFYLKNTLSGGAADVTIRFGPVSPGNIFPLAGDWLLDGDPGDTIGVYDARTGIFYLKNTLSGGAADVTIRFGPVSPGNIFPLAGAWICHLLDTIGVYDARTGTFYLKNTLSGGAADVTIRFGPVSPGNIFPLSGDWDAFRGAGPVLPSNEQTLGFEALEFSVWATPNPVRDVNTTRFMVQSTDPGMVVKAIRVEIFDLAGRLVYDSGWHPNGFEYHIVNNAGEVLPNGVYFYRVRARVNGQELVLKGYYKLAILR